MTRIAFDVKGKGNPVILLHGFPLTHQVWEDFSDDLSQHFKVYLPDLPGFGDSVLFSDDITLNDIADALIEWIVTEKISPAVIIGHSLGGYITLAIARKRPDLLAGFGLFHSTAVADSEEKKVSRTKTVDFVKRNGAEAFTINFIAPLFADQNNLAIAVVKDIARRTSARTVIAYTLAMRDRESAEDVITHFPKPILFLGGEKDQGISPDSLRVQAALSQQSELHILNGAAHMSMYEQSAESGRRVRDFAERCLQK